MCCFVLCISCNDKVLSSTPINLASFGKWIALTSCLSLAACSELCCDWLQGDVFLYALVRLLLGPVTSAGVGLDANKVGSLAYCLSGPIVKCP